MHIIAVTGLAKEARIAKRAGLTPVISACDAALLRSRLHAALDGAVAVVSFGIAGSLSPLLEPGDTVIGSHVVSGRAHYICNEAWVEAMAKALPKARKVIVAGSDITIASPRMKEELRQKTGAHCVDMESHIAARFAEAHDLPFVVLRTISDGVKDCLPPAAELPLKPNGKPNMAAVFRSIKEDPGQMSDLLRTAKGSGKAFKSLVRARRHLGPGLGYIGMSFTDLR